MELCTDWPGCDHEACEIAAWTQEANDLRKQLIWAQQALAKSEQDLAERDAACGSHWLTILELAKKLEARDAEIERLREALLWYSVTKNYYDGYLTSECSRRLQRVMFVQRPILVDMGNIARTALAGGNLQIPKIEFEPVEFIGGPKLSPPLYVWDEALNPTKPAVDGEGD